jgi:hypothetical protein
MNAKSKFTIPILQGTRPEVGLFSATVAAPSLRNASNLVSGVAVSNYPMVTTSVTSNNAYPIARNTTLNSSLDIQDIRYPGTNSLLAYQNAPNQLGYLNSSKKTIQLDNTLNVSGARTSDMMVEYLKTGKLEGDLNAQTSFTTTVLATGTNSNSLTNTSLIASELYDCSPNFGKVSGLAVEDGGAGYPITTGGIYTTRAYNYSVSGDPQVALVQVTSTAGAINSPVTVVTGFVPRNINERLTVEDGQVVPGTLGGSLGVTLLSPGSGYNIGDIALSKNIIVNASPGQGLVLGISGVGAGGIITDLTLQVTVGFTDMGSGYSVGDIIELEGLLGGSGALIQITGITTATTLASLSIASLYNPGSGAPLGPYDSYTVPDLPVTSESNICKSKVPKARIYTAGGAKAYYPQISSGLYPTNWNAGNGAALCANPALCLPVGISSQNGRSIVNGVPV